MPTFDVTTNIEEFGLLGNQSITVNVVSGDTLYYNDSVVVSASSNQGSLTAGGSGQTFTEPIYVVSAGRSSVHVTYAPPTQGGGVGITPPVGDIAGTVNAPVVATVLNGKSPMASNAWVDLCSAPYNHSPGDDVTADLQTAVSAADSNNRDTTIYFSKPGTYFLNGAQQTGTDGTHSWTGQILIPKRTYFNASGLLTIRILGTPTPAGGGMDGSPSGTILQSIATTGNVFDAIPGNSGVGAAYTFVHLTFEDIGLRTPSNPQCQVVEGRHLANLEFRGNVNIDTAALNTVPTLTGTGAAVQFPPFNNMGVIGQTSGYLTIIGYPTGFTHCEHFVCEDIQVDACNIAVAPYGGVGHSSRYKRLLIQGCANGIQPTGSCSVEGFIDIGDQVSGQVLAAVVNDASNQLYGTLMVSQHNVTNAPGFPGVWGPNPALNLRFVPYIGRPSDWPSDDFSRLSGASTSVIGVSANTHHIWSTLASSTFSTAGGVLKSTRASGTSQAEVVYQVRGKAGPSRTIRVIWALVGTYNVWVMLSKVLSGANANNQLGVGLNGGVISLSKTIGGTATTLAASAAATVAAGNTYTVDVVVSNPVGGPYALSVYLNGVIVPITLSAGGGSVVSNAYQLSAAEVTALSDTDILRTRDALGFFSDTGSSVSRYAVAAG